MIVNHMRKLIDPLDKRKKCKSHGITLFRHKKNKKSEWWVCEKCLREQWKKATKKRLNTKEGIKYNRNYSKELNKIRKCLSVYLTMILIAAEIKPE
jgi:hypothetical protein